MRKNRKQSNFGLNGWLALIITFVSTNSFAQVEFEVINCAQKMLSAENFELTLHQNDSASLQVEDEQEYSTYYLRANETPYWRYFPEANLAITSDFNEFDYFVKEESGTFQLGSILADFNENIGKIRTFDPQAAVLNAGMADSLTETEILSKTIYYPYFVLNQGVKTSITYLGERTLRLSTTDTLYTTHLYLEQNYYTDTYTTVKGNVYQNQSDSIFVFLDKNSGERLFEANYSRSFNTPKPRSGQEIVAYQDIEMSENLLPFAILVDLDYENNTLYFTRRDWPAKTKILIYTSSKKRPLAKYKYSAKGEIPTSIKLPENIEEAVLKVVVKEKKGQTTEINLVAPWILKN